jgi:hypothetical protein
VHAVQKGRFLATWVAITCLFQSTAFVHHLKDHSLRHARHLISPVFRRPSLGCIAVSRPVYPCHASGRNALLAYHMERCANLAARRYAAHTTTRASWILTPAMQCATYRTPRSKSNQALPGDAVGSGICQPALGLAAPWDCRDRRARLGCGQGRSTEHTHRGTGRRDYWRSGRG